MCGLKVADRIILITVMLNVLRLGMATQEDMLSRLQLGRVPGSPRQGCSVIIFDGYVVKRIKYFSTQSNTCHKFEYLQQVRRDSTTSLEVVARPAVAHAHQLGVTGAFITTVGLACFSFIAHECCHW